MNKIIKVILGVVAVLIIASAVWLIFGQKNSVSPEKTIKIGGVYSLTGPLAGLGEQFKDGAVFAVDIVNKQGGINGKEIALLVEDNQSTPQGAVLSLNKLLNIDKVKYFSSFGSSICLALKPIIEESNTLLVADASHPKITENSQFVLRHSNVALSDAGVLIEKVKEKNPEKVGIIYVNDDWGVVLNQESQRLLKEFNLKVEIASESHLASDTDLRSQISKILAIGPDAVLVASFGNPSGFIIKQLRELGYKGDIFANAGFALAPDAQKIAGTAADGIYYQTFQPSPQFSQDFLQEYGREVKGPFARYVYTDIELLKSAIEKVGESPLDITQYIKSLKIFKGKYEEVEILPTGDIIFPTEMKIWKSE
jgi:branched-chain amino acid transport system substrate-binding protein